MNGAGVMVVITSSKGSGLAATRAAGFAPKGDAAATERAEASCAAASDDAGGFDATPSLPPKASLLASGLGRTGAEGAFACAGALEGSFGPGGPMPSVVARAASAEMRGADSSTRSESETRSGSSESKRGNTSSSGAAGPENGFWARGLVGASLPKCFWLRPDIVGAGIEFCFGIALSTSTATASTPIRFCSAL